MNRNGKRHPALEAAEDKVLRQKELVALQARVLERLRSRILPIPPCTLTMTGLQAMAVHGSLCLALRHPGNTGPSTEEIRRVIQRLELYFTSSGLIRPEELSLIHLVDPITEEENTS